MFWCHPEWAADVAEGASTPSGGYLPVQRKLDALHRRCALGIGRSYGCACGLFWLQKSTSGIRSRCVFTASRKLAGNPPGPGHPALCTVVTKMLEAGSVMETSRPR